MKTPILVSVCMPTYNDVTTIDSALQSVLNQTYPHFEILISDNCSTDGTYEKIIKYKDPRLKISRNAENIGWRLNSNKVLKQASGKYVVTLHGDDYYKSNNYLKKVIELFETYENVGVIHFVPETDISKKLMGRTLMKSEDYYSFTGSLLYMPAPSVTAYRKSAIDNSDYYAKHYWTGEARLSLTIASRGFDALYEINNYVYRRPGKTRDGALQVNQRFRKPQRYEFFLEYKYDPKIKLHDLAVLIQSFVEKRKTPLKPRKAEFKERPVQMKRPVQKKPVQKKPVQKKPAQMKRQAKK